MTTLMDDQMLIIDLEKTVAQLEAENANLKEFIKELQHDFEESEKHCSKYHTEIPR